MKKFIEQVDATPIKNIYLSIIHDYDLKSALSELIDNAIDAWRATGRQDALEIDLSLDTEQQTITIRDNAGGVPKHDLHVLVSPGSASPTPINDPIGIFGVGSKRSVVALAGRIEISTRKGNEPTYHIEYDDAWINDDSGEWLLPVFQVTDIEKDTTLIELTKLRTLLTRADVDDLKAHISATYAYYLENENIWIAVDGTPMEPRFFHQWAYPPDYPPISFKKIINFGHEEQVQLTITAGLTLEERKLGGDYGVFVYCNRRLVARALRSVEVGFVSGLAGVDHHAMNLARIIVDLYGPPRQMPWTSKKEGLYYAHPTFQAIREDVVAAVSNCTKWSKRLKPTFNTDVEPFTTGEISVENLPVSNPIKNRMPAPPRVRKDARESIVTANRPQAYKFPFVKGLYESVIAVEVIQKQKMLTQRNRICWIILDSCVEIACKEYLVNIESSGISDDRLQGLNRKSLQEEVEKHVLSDDPIWRRFRYNYQIRNNFVHRKADATVSDDDIQSFLHDVKRFLNQGFGLIFPSQ